ncbi:MAG TPA: FimV/HubP family polar landmark protein, partial [Methylophilaceae bacterium]|nr:FimV/HubP family polar landmark protein [Methylophilaceae bacterium]
MHKSKLRRILLAVCLTLVPLLATAAGLGRLNVISGLGEPLNAEIELISTTPEELASLTAVIAPAEAYNAQGLERPAISNAIKIDVNSRPGGKSVLKLSTHHAVTDPFLDMLVQVDWSTGRLLREYTILLDPPGYTTPSASDATNAPAITTQASPNTAPSGTASQDPFAEAQPAAAGAVQTHETARGDTLNAIAHEMQVEGVSLEQMLVGLYRANKQAFSGDNMNRLKVGQVIRAPAPEELQAIDQREAAREIRAQTADWNAYRNRLAGIVADADASAGDASGQSASGKLSGPAEDRAAPPSDAEQDVVKLSKSDSSTSDKSLQDKLNALQEEVTARENSLKEANERTAALEKQIQDMQELLEIKSQTLANLQQGAVEPNAAGSSPAADKAAPPTTKPAPAAVKPAAAPQPQATNLMDGLLQNPLLLPIALAVLAVLVIVWLLLRNKRRRELDSFEKGILTAGGLKANTVFGNTSGNTIDTGDTSFLTDFSQSTGGMIDTHDVDPIAEAEVYMAYGRDAQAEEILKDAIAKEPKRYELHLKLLEIF